MSFRDLMYRAMVKLRLRRKIAGAAAYEISPHETASWLECTPSPLAKMFLTHKGRIVHKWVHYLEEYESHFARFVGTDVRLLEIGVSYGGSLELWRRYFGKSAKITGIDVNMDCLNRCDPPNKVRIGSQGDPDFLRNVIGEMGGLDIVIDDGSHVGRHQRSSFETLFPILNDRGIYVIEDIHTSYWPGVYEGGYRRADTAIEFIKDLIDGMHAKFHDHAADRNSDAISAVHIYNWTVVIEKREPRPMGHFKIGSSISN